MTPLSRPQKISASYFRRSLSTSFSFLFYVDSFSSKAGSLCLLVNLSFLFFSLSPKRCLCGNWMQSTVSPGVFMQSGGEQAEVRRCQWRVKSAGRIDTWMTDTCKIHSRLWERWIICLVLHKTLCDTAQGFHPPPPPSAPAPAVWEQKPVSEVWLR